MRKYFIKNTGMVEAFAEAVHRAKPSKLRGIVKETTTRRIRRLRL